MSRKRRKIKNIFFKPFKYKKYSLDNNVIQLEKILLLTPGGSGGPYPCPPKPCGGGPYPWGGGP
jgi:hypothetical protein